MSLRFFALFWVLGSLLAAADKKEIATARGENEDLILNVTIYDDPAAVKELLGSDLDGHYIVADVRIEPKYGKEITIDRDDFVLQTDKDGEKATPFAPNQIAGTDALLLTHGPSEGAASPGMVLGGPVVLRGGGLGKGSTQPAEGAKATMQSGDKEKQNPLKKLLTDKILPEKKTEQPVSGLLYFAMEKQKLKNLELRYGGRENRITLRFK